MVHEEILTKLQSAEKREDKIEALNEVLKNLNPSTRLAEQIFLNDILNLLDDEDEFIRIKATEVSEYYRDEMIVDKLIKKLNEDDNQYVRGFAAKALGSIGNIKAKPFLEKALLDKEGFVVSFVSQSLKTINIKAAFSSKLELLKQKMKETAQK